MAALVAVHVRELVERELASHRGRGGLPGDVEDVVVVVVARPRALVGVLPDANLDGALEVVAGLEDIAGAEKRGSRAGTGHAQLHDSISQGSGGKDSYADSVPRFRECAHSTAVTRRAVLPAKHYPFEPAGSMNPQWADERRLSNSANG